MPLLRATADNYLLMNPNECVSQAEDAARYPLFRVESLISDHTLRLSGEVQLKFVLRWIDAELIERDKHFKKLLPHIRLDSVTKEDLVALIDNCRVFTHYGDNRRALYQALVDNGSLFEQ